MIAVPHSPASGITKTASKMTIFSMPAFYIIGGRFA